MISISTLSAADADFIASKEHSAMFVFVIAITTKPIMISTNYIEIKIPIAITTDKYLKFCNQLQLITITNYHYNITAEHYCVAFHKVLKKKKMMKYMYVLQTNLQPLVRFKTGRLVLKPAGPF